MQEHNPMEEQVIRSESSASEGPAADRVTPPAESAPTAENIPAAPACAPEDPTEKDASAAEPPRTAAPAAGTAETDAPDGSSGVSGQASRSEPDAADRAADDGTPGPSSEDTEADAAVIPLTPLGQRQAPKRTKKHHTVLAVVLILVLSAAVCAGGYWATVSLFPFDFSAYLDPGNTQEDGSGGALPEDPLPSAGDNTLEAADSEDQTSSIPRWEDPLDFQLTLQSSAGLTPLSYQEIYQKTAPSVVTITVYSDTGGGFASGIILSSDGLILTNQHVVGGNSQAFVTTDDDTTYEAQLVGEDPNTDLAVLKIDAEGLIPAVFGDSDELLVGDECFAIGNPLGITYRGTFSNGIISAINRDVTMNGYSMTLIQTTAALNTGNSGGPLINIYGQVIGVNNMKIMSQSTTVEGLGFAIPSQTAKSVADTLIAEGAVEHPALGITCYGLTRQGAEELGVPEGIMIATVDPGSDAMAQGLRAGDVIVEMEGQSVRTLSDVRSILNTRRVGDSVSLQICRDGAYLDVEIILMELNDMS